MENSYFKQKQKKILFLCSSIILLAFFCYSGNSILLTSCKEVEVGKIIFIDGPSNTGKTSLCECLAQEENFVYLKECTENLNSLKIPQNDDEEISNQLIYFEIEKKRLNEAINLSAKGKVVFLDRSILSIASIAYAFDKLEKFKTFEHAQNKCYEIMKNKKRPDVFIFLTADYDDLKMRNKYKRLSEKWLRKNFIEFQEEFYKNISNNLKNSFIINTSKKTLHEIKEEVINCINLSSMATEKIIA